MLPTDDLKWASRRNACSWLLWHLNGVGHMMFYRLQTLAKCEQQRERRQIKVLRALDVARTQWYHFTAVVIAGMGFFTDAYDLFCVSLVTDLLGRICYPHTGSGDPGSLPPGAEAAVKGIALCGTMFGQLFFGCLGDHMGRKRIYGVTLILMVVCSVASGLSFHHTPISVVGTLCFFRFWLGFGIGGDYPLSAAIMCEYANKNTRGAFMAAVFAMQGLGNLAAGIVVLVITASFMNTPAYKTGTGSGRFDQADYVWRIVLMFGAVPAALTFYWRMKMPETPRYTALVAKNLKQAVSDMTMVLDLDINELMEEEDANTLGRQGQFGLFSLKFMCRHGWHLVSASVCWFMLDVVFYSLNLFMMDIFTEWFDHVSKEGILEQTYKFARIQAIIAVSGSLPGYFGTVMFIDKRGRIRIQLIGFTMMTIFIIGLASTHAVWQKSSSFPTGFAVMYGFIFFFANFGPNTTTFIVPTEIFPTRLRSTCHGIAGAVGKAGAIVGVLLFLYAKQITVPQKLFMLAGCNLLGIIFTVFLPESKGMSLEDIAGDMQE
ncbi:hypothetical protein ACP70R_022565 [Stipagrostis hirtigluma subsp. patula]